MLFRSVNKFDPVDIRVNSIFDLHLLHIGSHHRILHGGHVRIHGLCSIREGDGKASVLLRLRLRRLLVRLAMLRLCLLKHQALSHYIMLMLLHELLLLLVSAN